MHIANDIEQSAWCGRDKVAQKLEDKFWIISKYLDSVQGGVSSSRWEIASLAYEASVII